VVRGMNQPSRGSSALRTGPLMCTEGPVGSGSSRTADGGSQPDPQPGRGASRAAPRGG